MPWTDSARRQYARAAERHATDLTDEEFALLAPHLPTPNRPGRPRTVDLREVINAILHLLRTGCPWNLLPKEFPPKSTVFGCFRRPWEDGTWATLRAVPVMAARERAGRQASPTAAILDRQSVRTTEAGGPNGGAWPRAGHGPDPGADGADQGETAARAAAREGLRPEIVRRDPGARGFAVLPRRRVVERTFAWLGRNRRLARDFETTLASALTMLHLASLQLLVRRLARA
jgi:transposase